MNAEYYEKGRQFALKLADANDDFYNSIVARAGGPLPKPEPAAPKPAPKPVRKPAGPAGTMRAPTSRTGGSQADELRREGVSI
jgi:hypothetical protein